MINPNQGGYYPRDTSDNFKNQLLNRIAHESRPEVKDLARLAVIDNYLKERVTFIADPRNAEAVSTWVINASVEQNAPVFDKFGRAVDYMAFSALDTQITTMFDGRKFAFVLEQLKPALQPEPRDSEQTERQHVSNNKSWLNRFARVTGSEFSSTHRVGSPAEYFNNVIQNIVHSRLDENVHPFWLYEAGWSLGMACHEQERLVIITLG